MDANAKKGTGEEEGVAVLNPQLCDGSVVTWPLSSASSGRPDLGNGKNASGKGTGEKAPTEEHVKFQRTLEDSQRVLGETGSGERR